MGDLKIKTCVLGAVATDCYLVYNERSKAVVVIDPADDSGGLIRLCSEMGLLPEAVLLTHGHWDHMFAAEALRRHWNCPVYVSQDEELLLKEPELNLSEMFGLGGISLTADRLVQDREVLSLLGCSWEVIATPGHTGGSICYYIAAEGVLFAGDTLFLESVGRSDFPTGNSMQLIRSIRERLLILPEDTVVYPGHGQPTAIAHELRYNPFVSGKS